MPDNGGHDKGSSPATDTISPIIDTNASLKYSLLGPSLTKAGQDAVDQNKVSQIIYNASKGSKFFSRESAKDEILTKKIEALLAHKARLEREAGLTSTINGDGAGAGAAPSTAPIPCSLLDRETRTADTLLAELELDRDMSRTIVHVDCDAFYAAVEQLDRPELATVPFAVGKGVLTTCNYIARTFGCRSGMAGFVAKKLCPELIQLPVNFSRYTEKAKEVRVVLAEYDPRFESASCDEAYLDFTDYCEESAMSPSEAVAQMRDQIRVRTGVTVSAGIAANSRLAKICSNVNKPNGQFLLPSTRAAIVDYMSTLPPRKVNGIGRVLERELAAIGVATCGDIYHHRGLLRPLFGEKAAHFLLAVHLGLGRTSVEPAESHERKSVGTERTFSDLSDLVALRDRLRQTADDLEADMLRVGCKGRTLCLKIKLHTYEVHTRQAAAQRRLLSDAKDMYDLALPMLDKLAKEMPGMKLRLMGLRCTGLVSTRKPDASAFFGLKSRPAVVRHKTERDEKEEEGGLGLDSRGRIEELEGAWDDVKDEEDDALVREAITLSQERAGIAVDEVNMDDDVTPNDTTQEDWWDCPVCSRPQPADERLFNQHIDLCLSRQTITDAVQDGDGTKVQASASAGYGASGFGGKKRARVKGLGHDPKQKKLRFQ